ncbi:hypothetical protein [Desulfopila aestuarii]|uniref:Uncharacterized protein n=1 Tax=Desulfopila aestuarii DSM 18488 TaxID=1121416 RepID=A0A1M7YM42_9BACT|nr:hypothetical protein [Desulfopila aestuarii]SHO53694.1 hypothetical protein SAMN02745220_05259 [Desulfopila aestuarii DSM 18488]
MQTRSLFFRVNTALVVLLFFFTSSVMFPTLADARKSENRTRTSIHKSGHKGGSRDRRPNRDIKRKTNINVNIRNDRGYRYDGRRHHYHRDYHRHNDVGRALVVGAIAGLVVGSVVTAASMPPACSDVYVNGYPYRQCGSTWYQPHYAGSQVNYVVVSPPR